MSCIDHEKSGFMPMRKQRQRYVTVQLIIAFVFATQLVQLLFFVNPTFQASGLFL